MLSSSVTAEKIFSSISEMTIYPETGDKRAYFFTNDNISSAINGNATLVIGRKGSGKSAIAQYIADTESSNAKLLNFGNFPFDVIEEFKEDGIAKNYAYINGWKTVILVAQMKVLLANDAIDPLAAKELKKVFTADPTDPLTRSSAFWRKLDFSLSAFGFEAKVSGDKSRFGDLDLFEKVLCLEKICRGSAQKIKRSTILLDELDLNFSLYSDGSDDQSYALMMCSLIRAASELSDLSEGRLRVIVFLRDDIFDILRDPDKNKWLDRAVRLEWTEDDLDKMLSFVISARSGVSVKLADLVANSQKRSYLIEGGQGEVLSLRKSLFELTHLRPRDLIMLLREVAKICLSEKLNIIGNDQVNKAVEEYSVRFRQEIVDEAHSVLAKIDDVFNSISKRRQVKFDADDLVSWLVADGVCDSKEQAQTTIQILYYYSVVGIIGTKNNVFRYIRRNSKLILPTRLVLHPGIRRAINFSH